MSTVALIGTFDTKGSEYLYVQGQLEALGLNTITINVGVFDPVFTPDISGSSGIPVGEKWHFPQ